MHNGSWLARDLCAQWREKPGRVPSAPSLGGTLAMKKLKLNLDDLRVESFATTPGVSGKPGTVFGQEYTFETCAPQNTCDPQQMSCVGCTGSLTCGACNPTSTCWWQETCLQTCNCGMTHECVTGLATDCPGETNCPPYTQEYTCTPSCTDAGCTACGQVC